MDLQSRTATVYNKESCESLFATLRELAYHQLTPFVNLEERIVERLSSCRNLIKH